MRSASLVPMLPGRRIDGAAMINDRITMPRSPTLSSWHLGRIAPMACHQTFVRFFVSRAA